MEFAFFNVNSIRVFTSMLIIVCTKTIILWLFPTESKQSHVRIIRLILTTFNNEQHPCKRVRVDEYGSLENSIDVTNLLVDELKISMETNGGDAYWINGKN